MKHPKTIFDFFGKIRTSDFSDFTHFKTSAAASWLGFGFLCLVISLLINYSSTILPKKVEVGMIAVRDIKADRNYEVVDEEATDQFRKEAMQNVLPVFDFDEEIGFNASLRISKSFGYLRQEVKVPWHLVTAQQLQTLKEAFESKLEVVLTPAEWDGLVRTRFSKLTEDQWGALMRVVLSRWIVDSMESLSPYQEKGEIIIRRIRADASLKPEEKETRVRNLQGLLTVDQSRELVARAAIPPSLRVRAVPSIVRSLAGRMMIPNVTFNRQETEKQRDEVARTVKNAVIKLQTGESIIRSGARYEPWHVKVLTGIQKEKSKGAGPIRFLGTFLFVALALGSTFYFSERFVKRFAPERKDYILIGFVIILILIVMRFSLSFAGVFHDAFFNDLPPSTLYYAIPVAGGVMMMRMVLSAEISLIMAVLLSVLAGILIGSDVNYTAYCLISGVAAGSSIAKADHRSAILRAGFYTGVISAFAVLGIHLIQGTSATRVFNLSSVAAHLGFAFCGGMFSSVFVLLVMPLVEFLFDYSTDIKLLELANLSHPLLRELIVRAPGTYHHSHVVGVLAEAAAEGIGANSLLARVGAYYHDIGKMKKPEYYMENMGSDENRHDVLSPHMSALIVQSHVKDGIALARAHKLPQQIIDMIPQHHGTKRIGYFYEKAKEMADPSTTGEVEEKDFRYPGPKPQSREAGVLMLADGVEAAARALKEKSPSRIQQTVERIIDKSFIEAQLDECDLTLKDLHEIGKSFTRILTALYHQRMEYPQEGASESYTVSATAPTDSDQGRKSASKDSASITRLKFPHR